MNYYIKGDKERAEEIKAAFEKKGVGLPIRRSCADDGLIYFLLDGEVFSITIKAIELFKKNPDYKELELPVEPKFKVGDWLWHNTTGVHPILVKDYSEQQGYKVEGLGLAYYLQKGVVENECRLWTIADAKDGDVLATGNIICIFKKLDKDGYYIISPCIYTVKGGLEVIDNEDDTIGSCGFKPATKEDRNLLFRKIKEAGYMWDEKKKELCKIQHYDIANFHAGMPVLVRNYDNTQWRYVQFSHCVGKDNPIMFNACGNTWEQCIPYEGNEHLLGTTEPCGEEYINW